MKNERFTVTVREASEMVSLGKTKLNELLASGSLTRVKVGRRTLITVESLRRLVGEQR